jgi:tetratricopeptide (TPR) repeat protein
LGTALWHYARGMAFAGKREFESAAQELAKLESFAGHKDLQADNVGFDPAATIVKLAARVLQGETASRAGRHEAGIAALREAVAMQDALRYNEPPEWHQPVRHQLGAALLEAGRAAEAEAVYLEDLKDNRENGWALFGLLQALRAQGRADAAQAAEARFKKAWERADVVLTASRF